eukprot:CAMPEP_0181189936 /NCGR_PEP_ID=MMETSP1096-20121128/11926_1 /TAXON_ID=156174 ORGANISM="Chrysochromulina ericina, Strain CCMP281" /NCGR_SAMPLE_ID=MMETSP1096 /ASSEMBLY_ACC=CAM_ASM_000453 /LENGTH=78 /DNA_ID=CAMNT_0023279119 /DNA_START=667 /DNA_END=903 /DNA_ORIENTATION=-
MPAAAPRRCSVLPAHLTPVRLVGFAQPAEAAALRHRRSALRVMRRERYSISRMPQYHILARPPRHHQSQLRYLQASGT